MQANYENCLAITLKWEGGDVNHPADPGGKTRWGVTQARYDQFRVSKGLKKKSVFTMVKSEMLEIYKTGYWDTVNGDTLDWGVDLATWDYAVNSGPARAKKHLLAVVGGSAVDTVKRLCAKRMSFVRGLSTWKTFGKGWSNRIADIEAKGVAMAVSSVSASKVDVEVALVKEADKAASAAKAQSNKATAAATAGGASGTTAAAVDTSSIDQWISTGLLVAGLIGLGVLVYFVYKARHDKARAKAYLAEAGAVADEIDGVAK